MDLPEENKKRKLAPLSGPSTKKNCSLGSQVELAIEDPEEEKGPEAPTLEKEKEKNSVEILFQERNNAFLLKDYPHLLSTKTREKARETRKLFDFSLDEEDEDEDEIVLDDLNQDKTGETLKTFDFSLNEKDEIVLDDLKQDKTGKTRANAIDLVSDSDDDKS